jgi:hypothetical protein
MIRECVVGAKPCLHCSGRRTLRAFGPASTMGWYEYVHVGLVPWHAARSFNCVFGRLCNLKFWKNVWNQIYGFLYADLWLFVCLFMCLPKYACLESLSIQVHMQAKRKLICCGQMWIILCLMYVCCTTHRRATLHSKCNIHTDSYWSFYNCRVYTPR